MFYYKGITGYTKLIKPHKNIFDNISKNKISKPLSSFKLCKIHKIANKKFPLAIIIISNDFNKNKKKIIQHVIVNMKLKLGL